MLVQLLNSVDALRLTCRRRFLAGSGALLLTQPAHAVTPVAFGTVNLKPGATIEGDSRMGALYVTARPQPQNSALQAGKVPPLASKRFQGPLSFPLDFVLTNDDLTVEYADVPVGSYERLDLLVSARYDTDGVAATRGPEDLVGRGSVSKRGSSDPSTWMTPAIELQGRGVTGKLLTGGK